MKRKITITALILALAMMSSVFAHEYTDVSNKAWYYSYIQEMYDKGIMTGKTSEIFDPNGEITRQETAVVLYRLAGEPGVAERELFPDVRSSGVFSVAINWGKQTGIIKGHADGLFRPNDSIIRQDFALLLYRIAGYFKYDTSVSEEMRDKLEKKADRKAVSDYALDAVTWACGRNIMGVGSDIKPLDHITRAEAAAMLCRFMSEYVCRVTHFSIDDCNDVLRDLTVNNYNNIFEQEMLGYLRELHEKYGIKVTLYLFSRNNKTGFSLEDMTSRYSLQFIANADWLKFGFHAIDNVAYDGLSIVEEMQYYHKTINEIKRFTKTDKTIDHFVRLDRFYATKEMVKALAATPDGVTGLYTPDSASRTAFGFDATTMAVINGKDAYVDTILYTPTDIRLENYTAESIDAVINKHINDRYFTFFTHEWKMNDPVVRANLEKICKAADKRTWNFI